MKKFKSLTDFANYLEKLKPIENAKKIEAMEVIGTYVKEKAESKFGLYQDAVGTFPKWDDLADSTQVERERLGYSPNDPLYRSGELSKSIEKDVTPNLLVVGSANPIMEWQEFGTVLNGQKHIPPRPVIGPAMLESLPIIKSVLSTMMENWLTGERKKIKST